MRRETGMFSRPRRAVGAYAIAAVLAAAISAGCGNLDDITTVKDLRVLAVRADPPGFLVDLQHPAAGAADRDLQATLTALVVDPKGGSQTVTYFANGCPDLILDAITSATGQGTKICPDPNAPSALPPEIAPYAATQVIVDASAPSTADPQTDVTTTAAGIEYHPSLPPFGLTAQQISLLFTPIATGNAVIDQSIAYNRDFGVDATVNVTFALGSEQATAVKRIIYWPDLSSDPTLAATFPADLQPQAPNHNPVITSLAFYRERDPMSGDPVNEYDGSPPTVSISARDRVFVQPVFSEDQAETYPLRVRSMQTQQITTQVFTELLVFDFFTTAGTFSPEQRRNSPPVFSPPGSPIHVDSELNLPAIKDLPPGGAPTDIWVVVHDERGGESWVHSTLNIVP